MTPHFFARLQVPPAKRELRHRLYAARRWMDQNYFKPLTLEEIARQACVSRFHFLRLFKSAFSQTPHQYLMQRRIQKAKEMLTAGGHSVTDVCFEVGFESLGSFSHLFRRQVGHPPASYRMGRHQASLKPLPMVPVPACFLAMYGQKRRFRAA
jgi:AraC-like DNA-binding protein